MFSEKRVEVGSLGLNLAVGQQAGPPLLLLHGVTRCWQTFLTVIPALAVRWHVHGLDFPGHGNSEPIGGDYRVIDYIGVTAAFVREHFEQPVAIYGHSLGSMVAAGVAAAVPEKTRAIILEDPPFETMGNRIRETPLHNYFEQIRTFVGSTRPLGEVAKGLAEVRLTDPQTGKSQRLGDYRDGPALRFAASCLSRLDRRVLDPIVEERWLDGFDWQAGLSQIECPALLVQADVSAGGMLIDPEARCAEERLRDVTRVKLPGVGHNVHWDRPVEMAKLATAFLESLHPGTPSQRA